MKVQSRARWPQPQPVDTRRSRRARPLDLADRRVHGSPMGGTTGVSLGQGF